MIEVQVEKTANVDTEQLWLKLSDFGDLSWFPGPQKIESIGSGPGMVRRIYLPEGGVIEEKLESLDNTQKSLTYSIAQTPAFPFSDYQAKVSVTEAGEKQAAVIWQSRFDAGEVPESEAKAMLEGTYSAMIDALVDLVNTQSDHTA